MSMVNMLRMTQYYNKDDAIIDYDDIYDDNDTDKRMLLIRDKHLVW